MPDGISSVGFHPGKMQGYYPFLQQKPSSLQELVHTSGPRIQACRSFRYHDLHDLIPVSWESRSQEHEETSDGISMSIPLHVLST